MTYLKTILSAGVLLTSTMLFNTAASAATAHNSQAGGIGMSSNAGASTVGSRRVKHADKHRMQ